MHFWQTIFVHFQILKGFGINRFGRIGYAIRSFGSPMGVITCVGEKISHALVKDEIDLLVCTLNGL